jgi:hypothetical protein
MAGEDVLMAGEALPAGAFGPGQAPIPVTETPADPYHYFSQFSGELPTSYWEGLKTEAKLSFENGPTSALFRALDLSQVEQSSGAKLHPNELNKRFPEVDQPFTEPTSLPVAEEIARRARDRHELESVVARSSVGGGARFGAGLVAGALDPLNLGAAIVSGGLLRAAGILGEATSVSRYAANAAIEGVAGAAIPEAISGYAAVQEHQDYGLGDYFKNVATAGAGFAGLSTAGKYLFAPAFKRGFGKAAEFLSRNPEAERVSHEAAVGQLMLDRQVDVEPISRQMVQETSAPAPRPGLPEYHFSPIENSDQVRERQLYHGSEKSMGSLIDAPKNPIEENFGRGVYLTDNPLVANGHASGTFTNADGKIFQVSVDHPELNLIHLDKRLEQGPARNVVESYLEEQKTRPEDHAVAVRETTQSSPLAGSATMKDALEHIQSQIQAGRLPADALDQIGARLKGAGFDGYVYQGGSYLEGKGAPHNIVMLLDPQGTGDAGGLAQERGQFAPEPAAVSRPTPTQADEVAKAQAAPENGVNYDAAAAQEFEQKLREPAKEMELPDLKEHDTVAMDALRKLKEEGGLSPQELKEFERLSELEAAAKEEETTIKAGMFCLGRDL